MLVGAQLLLALELLALKLLAEESPKVLLMAEKLLVKALSVEA